MATSYAPSDTALEFANNALLELGIREITSFTQNTLTARTTKYLYGNTQEEALGSYPWRFARGQRKIIRCTSSAPVPWESKFDIDEDVLNIITVYEGDQKVLFERMGDQVVTMTSSNSTQTMWLEGTMKTDEALWPSYFRKAFIHLLAAELAMPLTKDDKLRQIYEQSAVRRFALAKTRDSQGRSPAKIDTKGFIRARRSSGGFSNGMNRFV